LEDTVITSWRTTDEIPPRCPSCNGYLRPDVVWFGENLPAGVLEAAKERVADCQVFFSIGTSSIVYPADSLPQIALDNGAAVVEVNIQNTPLTSQATYKTDGLASEVLPILVEVTWP
jgi:NAD-dependent deacetylase